MKKSSVDTLLLTIMKAQIHKNFYFSARSSQCACMEVLSDVTNYELLHDVKLFALDYLCDQNFRKVPGWCMMSESKYS